MGWRIVGDAILRQRITTLRQAQRLPRNRTAQHFVPEALLLEPACLAGSEPVIKAPPKLLPDPSMDAQSIDRVDPPVNNGCADVPSERSPVLSGPAADRARPATPGRVAATAAQPREAKVLAQAQLIRPDSVGSEARISRTPGLPPDLRRTLEARPPTGGSGAGSVLP
jgi:hypothetical protein